MSNNTVKKRRAMRYKQRTQEQSREVDMMRRALGLPTDYELMRDYGKRPAGIMNAGRVK